MMSEEQIERSKKLSDTRALLDWLEAHPEIALPHAISYDAFQIYTYDTKEEAAMVARAMGTCEKDADDSFLRLTKSFGSVKLQAVFSRNQVCERVVTGVREVPEKIIPEKIEPARTEEIVEWHCPKLLDEFALLAEGPDIATEGRNALIEDAVEF